MQVGEVPSIKKSHFKNKLAIVFKTMLPSLLYEAEVTDFLSQFYIKALKGLM